MTNVTPFAPKTGIMHIVFSGDFDQIDYELRGHFNTFRRGVDLSSKLFVGNIIELKHAEGESIGHAVVTEMFSGPIEYMLYMHSSRNHVSDDPIELRGALGEIYGREKCCRGEIFTVIYLVRIIS